MDSGLNHVSDTALLVAAARASETESPNGLVRDPYAASLAGERGMSMVSSQSHSRWMTFGIGMRSRFIDELLEAELQSGVIDCVLSLGAGLDARPWRLALPANLVWIEVDFAPILDYKHGTLRDVPAQCRLQRLTADLTVPAERQSVLAEATANGRRTLLLTEGLLYYLPASAVDGIATESAARPGFASWILDITSEELMQLQATGTRVIQKFGHETRLHGEQILETIAESGWELGSSRTFMKEGAPFARARAKEYGWTPDPNSPRPSPDDPAGVWLFRRPS